MTDEPALASLASDVAGARDALLAAARQDPGRWWTGEELREEVANGWSPAVVMIALNELISRGDFQLGPRMRIRPAT